MNINIKATLAMVAICLMGATQAGAQNESKALRTALADYL